MTYKKAEIRVLGEASAVIQNFTKELPSGEDVVDPSDFIRHSTPAYDLDE